MGHTWKNGSHLEKQVTLGKMGQNLLKWITFRKVGHTWNNGSQWMKWFTFGKVGQTWSNGSHLEERVTLEKNWVTF